MFLTAASIIAAFSATCSADLLRGWGEMTSPKGVLRALQEKLPFPEIGPLNDGFVFFTALYGPTGYKRHIRPLGSCYQTSQNGSASSEIASQLYFLKDGWTVTLHVYDDKYCLSEDPDILLVSMEYDADYFPNYEKTIKRALRLPPWADGGYLWTSYTTEDGCVGNPAGWEVGLTNCAMGEDRDEETKYSAKCDYSDNSMEVYIHTLATSSENDTETSEQLCSTDGNLLYKRTGECTMYPSEDMYGNNILFQTNMCLKGKGKPGPKDKKPKNFFQKMYISISHFFGGIGTKLGI